MKLDFRRKRISVALVLGLSSSATVLVPCSSVRASDWPAQIVASTKNAYKAEQRDLFEYSASTDAAIRLAFARLLNRGKIASASNPLRVPDIDAAIEVYRGLLSTRDGEIRAKAASQLAELLMRKGGAENEKEAAVLQSSLTKPAPTAAGEAMEQNDAPVDLESDLRDKMANGSLDAAFDLLLLQARQNPSEVDTLRSQILLMANLAAQNGDSAVVRLAGRYAGSFDAQKHPEALKALFDLAAGSGSENLIGLMEKNREALLSLLGKDQVRETVWQLLYNGSTRAAELIALDLVDENVYGFDEADAKWAIEALNDAGSYRANYVTAKLYYQGIYVERDPNRAAAAMERMLAGAEAAGQERITVADRFARMNLSDNLVAKYALPIYLDIWKTGDKSVVARLARIIASAEWSGYYTSAADMPVAPADLAAELTEVYAAGDLSAGMILGDIYREGRLIARDATKARTIYEDLRLQYADNREMQLKLREQLAKLVRQDLEVTSDHAAYYAEVRDLAAQNNLWAMREIGLLLSRGSANTQADPEAGFDILLKALSKGNFPAGPDAADIAIAKSSASQLKRIADVYAQFDPRILNPENKVQLAKVDIALKHFDQAEHLLNPPEVQELPAGRFLLTQVLLSRDKLTPTVATQQMKDVILGFRGDDGQLLQFIQELARQRDLGVEFIEPVLERLATVADKNDLVAINTAFRLRQIWPSSQALSFRNVVDWAVVFARRGVSEPVARIAINANPQTIGAESYGYLVDKVEEAISTLPTNGSLRMFLARIYLQGAFRTQDLEKARQLTQEAAELGNLEALNAIATDYYNGQNVAMDRDRAEVIYRDLAFVGSNRSALALARSYSKAPSSRVYENRAFAYYIKAATGGSVTAMAEVGRNYLVGAGVDVDEAEAISWLKKAAESGSTDAMTQLYYYYFTKDPTDSNADAETWLDKLVEAEVPEMIIRKVVVLRHRDKAANREQIFALLNRAEYLGSQFARRLKNNYLKESR